MFSSSSTRHAVKVVSASLVESFPLTTAAKKIHSHRATLTVHLHRSSLTEVFGVGCAFGVAGHASDLCFVRSFPPALAASSSILSSLLRKGAPATPDALCLWCVNGEVSPSQSRLSQLMSEGRDVVLQCAVADVAAARSIEDDDEGGETRMQEEEPTLETTEEKTPKRRGRKPKRDMSASSDGAEADTDPTAADDAETPLDEVVEEDASAEDAPKKTKRRGRPPAKQASRRVLKRAQNKGRRSTVTPLATEAEAAADGPTFEEDDDTNAVGSLASAAADVTTEVMEALQSISPAKELPSKKRHRRTKAEMAAARLQSATAGEKATEGSERKDDAADESGEEGDAWFRGGNARAEGTEEAAAAAEDTPVTAKRRGRKSKKDAALDEDAESASAPTKRKKKTKAVKKSGKLSRTRKVKASDNAEVVAEAEAIGEEDDEAQKTAAKPVEEEGEDMAF